MHFIKLLWIDISQVVELSVQGGDIEYALVRKDGIVAVGQGRWAKALGQGRWAKKGT